MVGFLVCGQFECLRPFGFTIRKPMGWDLQPPYKKNTPNFPLKPTPAHTTIFYHKHVHHYHIPKPSHHKNHFPAIQNHPVPSIVIPLVPLLSCQSQKRQQHQHEANHQLA